MNARIFVLGALLAAAIVGCDKKEEATPPAPSAPTTAAVTAPATASAVASAAPASADDGLDEADYEDEAADSITETNFEAELVKLEAEIE